MVTAVPLVFVVRKIIRAARRAASDEERLRELDQLELAWKFHVEHSALARITGR